MSLIRYAPASSPLGITRFGWLDDAGRVKQVGSDDVGLAELLTTVDTVDDLVQFTHGRAVPVTDVMLRCPVPAPRRVLAAAGNYIAGGRKSLGRDAQPWLFTKMADSPIGPGEPIPLPPLACDVVEEIELAIVIGRPGRDIPVDAAARHITGWTICNDVSARRLVLDPDRRPGKFAPFFDWLNGKWFDGFLSLGPRIVGPREIGDVKDLAITTRVNDETRVRGSTASMTFSPEELVAFASRLMTLRPTDIIASGMPHGAAPETYLQAGDLVEGEIQGIGILANPVEGLAAT